MSHEFEFYPTPDPFTRHLVQTLGLYDMGLNNLHLCEPCVGAGDIIEAVNRVTKGSWWSTNDLDPRWTADTCLDAAVDDDAYKARGDTPHWVITNPPFSVALEIAERSLCNTIFGVALYHRCTLMEPLKTPGLGRSFFREHPPTMTLWLPRFAHQRSKSTGKWSTDSATCVWSVWIHGREPVSNIWPDDRLIDETTACVPAYRARVDELMISRGCQ